MKVDSNMETDRLLHRFARRRQDASLTGAEPDSALGGDTVLETRQGGPHLDADEVSAYAENALPEAARARYTSHLSDCDSCRKLVTELVLSSGVIVELEAKTASLTQKHERSWRHWPAAMLAPGTLRYAASVIVLIGILAVAFVVFRGGRARKFETSDSQAKNDANNINLAGAPEQGSRLDQNGLANERAPLLKPDETAGTKTPTGASSPAIKDAPGGVPIDVQKSGQEQGQAKPHPPVSLPDDYIAGLPNTERDEDSELATRQQPATGAVVADKPMARKKIAGADSSGRDARESSAPAKNEPTSNTEGNKIADSKAPAPVEEKTAENRRARRKSESASASSTAGASMDDRIGRADGVGTAEERHVVSGRQFVRRNGAWIDVVYRSQATTNIKRGSEQYRALVADEPGLRAIASQLDGEVVVVWKGRAYRIR